ncbi:Protein of unknown function DUF3716 [Penicillium cf. griseofulvum]|uniref:Uncharacterized protein n=1 Tax=Penicillium cf. griseofulvum TaxID=2972120 RepID=A0A9W9MEZ8_9EURO|nr:Protein of unknown function DUF3716 [Penicillium cf. griseofulvum]KAJ5424431.1 Protein of unknown function DUF3716 [Penicillium cf. griseofulvum]KAJ5442326.1 Protein of unknown function DUF3716 [Penicillium cf. griseofulvum]
MGDRPKSDFVAHLLAMPSRNELILRSGTWSVWSASMFSENIGESLTNVEAILIQVVGTRQEVPCKHCEERRGPFAHCVRIPEANNHWGNCHWGGDRDRCSFNEGPIAPKPTRVRRPKMTDEEYRTHQETVRVLREKKGQLMGLRREQQRDVLDYSSQITTSTTTSDPNQPNPMTSFISSQQRALEMENLTDEMLDDLFALVDKLL